MKTFIAGHTGMVGSAILRKLSQEGQHELVTRTRSELDLTRQDDVARFMRDERPEVVVLAAARVGGIHANNTYPADFIRDNLAIQTNVIHEAYNAGVEHLLFLGSSCIYPRDAVQPMCEEILLTGPLELTNDAYAIAKIAGMKMCESYRRQHGRDFRSVMPTNLYGPWDNFHLENSHVLPALIRRFHEAKRDGADSVTIWGTGMPRREFLHVDDMADACLFVLGLSPGCYEGATGRGHDHLNVGTGSDISIANLADMVREAVGYNGRISFDTDRPDGTMRKRLDVSRMESLGWTARIGLAEGIAATYEWFREHHTVPSAGR